MIGVDKLSVALFLEGQEIEVGELVLSNRQIYFKYFRRDSWRKYEFQIIYFSQRTQRACLLYTYIRYRL